MKEFADGLVLTDEEWGFLLRHVRFLIEPTEEQSRFFQDFSRTFSRDSEIPLAYRARVSRKLLKLRKGPSKRTVKSAKEMERVLLDCSEFSVSQLAFLLVVAQLGYRSSMYLLEGFETGCGSDNDNLISLFKWKAGLCFGLEDKLRKALDGKRGTERTTDREVSHV